MPYNYNSHHSRYDNNNNNKYNENNKRTCNTFSILLEGTAYYLETICTNYVLQTS